MRHRTRPPQSWMRQKRRPRRTPRNLPHAQREPCTGLGEILTRHTLYTGAPTPRETRSFPNPPAKSAPVPQTKILLTRILRESSGTGHLGPARTVRETAPASGRRESRPRGSRQRSEIVPTAQRIRTPLLFGPRRAERQRSRRPRSPNKRHMPRRASSPPPQNQRRIRPRRTQTNSSTHTPRASVGCRTSGNAHTGVRRLQAVIIGGSHCPPGNVSRQIHRLRRTRAGPANARCSPSSNSPAIFFARVARPAIDRRRLRRCRSTASPSHAH